MPTGMVVQANGQFMGQNVWKNDLLIGAAFPVVIGAGNSVDGLAVDVSGLSVFMAGLNFTGVGGTLAISLIHLDPTTGANFSVRVLSAGLAPAPDLIVGFGAGSALLAGDVFQLVKFRFTAVVAAQTINNLLLWGRAR